MRSLFLSLSEFRLRQILRGRASSLLAYLAFRAEGFAFFFLSQARAIWFPPFRPLAAFLWLTLWARLFLRFGMRSSEDRFLCWDAPASALFSRMALSGRIRPLDRFRMPELPWRPAGIADALSLAVANCSSLSSIGCDETRWSEWVESLRGLLLSDSSAKSCRDLLAEPADDCPRHPAEPIFRSMSSLPERLMPSSSESPEAFAAAARVALRFSSLPAPLETLAPLAIDALSGADASAESFWEIASVPGGAHALLAAGEGVSSLALAALRDRVALGGGVFAPSALSARRSL